MASKKESDYASTVSSGIDSFAENVDPNLEADCSFKINLCFAEQSTQTIEMKDSVNECVDSITTPIYVNRISDIEPTTMLTSKPKHYEITVAILDAKLLKQSDYDCDFVVNVEIGELKKRTTMKQSQENVAINECFTFYFNTIPDILFNKTLTINFLRNKSLLRFYRSIGHFNIDISTIFAQKDHRFYHKWAPIVDDESVLKGYVKCDLLVTTPNMILSTPITTDIDEDNIEENLLIPRSGLTTGRRRVKYTVNVYRAEGLPSLKSSFKSGKSSRVCMNAFVTVSFDEVFCKTNVCRTTLNPVWNEQITFESIYPPLCQQIKIEVCNGEQVLTTHFLNLHELSSDELQLLPTFGPSFIYLYGSPNESGELTEGLMYYGRLLLSLDAEYCDESENGETKSLSDVIVTEASPVDISNAAREDEFLFFAAISESNLISRKFANKRISYELSIGHMDELSSESMFDVSVSDSVSVANRSTSLAQRESWSVPNGDKDEREPRNARSVSRSNTIRSRVSTVSTMSRTTMERPDVTVPMKSIVCDKQYAYLPIGATKPCLYSRGYYPDLRRRLYHSNVIEKVADELQAGLADCELLDFLTRREVCRRLRGVFEELATGCNRYAAMAITSRSTRRNKLDIQRYKHREKILQTIEMEALSIKDSINDDNYKTVIHTAYQWLYKIRDLIVDPQDAFPDIFIWMIVDGKKVAFSRLKARNYIFSHVDDDKGKCCSRYHNVMLRSVKSHRKLINRLNIYGWFGTVKYKAFFPRGLIAGFDQNDEIDNADVIEISPPRSLRYSVYHTFELRAHIYQAILTSFSSGLLNPFVKIIFNDFSMTTQTIEETLGPLWDVTLVMPEVLVYGDKQSLKTNPPSVEVEIYDKDLKSNNSSLIGRCSLKSVFRAEEDKYEIPKLDWTLAWCDADWTAELLAVVEIIQLSNSDDLMQYPAFIEDHIDIGSKDNYHAYRIPECIRPKLSKYKLEVLFMGLRDLKKIQFMNIEKPRVDIELAGHTLSSNELGNFKENPNFSNPLKFIDVDLPDDDLYAPPLTIRVVHKSFGQLTLAGSHVIPFIFKLIYKDFDRTEGCVDIGIDPRKYISNKELVTLYDGIDSGTSEVSEEPEIDWWYRYKASINQTFSENADDGPTFVFGDNSESTTKESSETSKNLLIKVYDTELEKSKDFGSIAEWGLRSFPLYRSKKRVITAEPDETDTSVGIFKGSIQLYKYPIPDEVNTEIKDAVDPISILVRVYIVDAQNLVSKSSTNRINPYITFILGGKKASEKDNYVSNQQNPTIGKCFEFEASFPQDSMLTIQVNGYDRFGVDYLIGETKIDLENRFYSRHRCTCGLPQVYETEGPNKWRDSSKPSEILEKLCNDLKLNGPEFWDDSIKIGKYSFVFTTNEIDAVKISLNKEQMCLAVLNNWKQAFGYALIPEHIETRQLFNSRKPGLPQGSLHMWVDMFSRESGTIPPPLDISPRRLNCFELRVTIIKVTDVRLKDVTFFTGVRTGNLFVKGWIVGKDTQITDTQQTFTGETSINWRFKFPFDYSPKEKVIVECQQSGHKNKLDKSTDANLNIQLWDSRALSHHKLLGHLCLNLNKIACFARTARQCTLLTTSECDNSGQISLFKDRVVQGWWPLVKEKHGESSLTGKIHVKLELLTKEEAIANPAGFGRNAPQPLEKPPKRGPPRLTTLRRHKQPVVLPETENIEENT